MRKTSRELNEIMLAAPFVMGVRLSRMMLPDDLRSANDRAEDARMVAEKAIAASQGLLNMQVELAEQMSKTWLGMAFGQMPKPIRAADQIIAAGLKPARRKVKSNVKRLSRRKVSK